jgi:predicted adenine nucleotide alpha hydrolase (AANH) superfamily ATPase
MQKYCGCIFSEEERYAQAYAKAYAKKPKPGDPA